MGLDRCTQVGLFALAGLAVLGVLSANMSPASSADQKPPENRDVRYVVFHVPGPKWIQGKPIFEQQGVEAHIAHYRTLLEQHKLMAGGPFLDGIGGGMMIPEPGLTEQEIAAFAAADPAVIAGLLTFEVRPWLIGMKK